MQMFRSLFFSSPPLSPPSHLPHLSSLSLFDPLLIIALKDTVCTNRSRVAHLSPSKEVFSLRRFLLRKRAISISFCREIENPRRVEGEGRTKAEERLTRPVQMSRDPAGFYEAHSRVINAARTSILISKLTKLEIRRYGAILSKRGNTLACHRCFAFCRVGFETAQKGQCLRERRREREVCSPGQLLFESALPRLNRGQVVTPRKIYLS